MKVRSISPSAIQTFPILLLAIFVLLQTGCSQPDSATAVERNSTKKPLFKSDIASKVEVAEFKVPDSGKKLEFVHADHFGIFSLDVDGVTNSETLSKVEWPMVAEMLTEMVGTGSLEKVENVWLLLDREYFSLVPTGDESQNAMVFVIDSREDIDLAETASRLRKTLPPKLADQSLELSTGKITKITEFKSVYIPTSKRMLVGSHDALSKLVDNKKPNQILVDKYYQLDEKYLSGVVDVTAIRSQFQMIFGMIGSIGPMKDYAKLPEALKQIDFEVDLDAKEMMSVNLRITDKPLAQLIANAIQSSGGNDAMPGMPGMSGMFGSGMPSFKTPKVMYMPQSTETLQAITEEITEKQLISVRLKDDFVKLKMARPDTLDELVSSVIYDQMRTSQIAARYMQAIEIADALKEYERKFEHLPPAGLVTPDNADENKRAQFNWLTGILPELGKQDLYDQFDFSQPFDAPQNWKLVELMPKAFGKMDGLDGDAVDVGQTAFCVLGGKGLWGDGTMVPSLKQIKDNQAGTAIVGEASEAKTWTDPSAALLLIDNINDIELGHADEQGWIVITADFKLRVIGKDESKTLNAIISPEGGEKVLSSAFIQIDLPKKP